MSVNSSGTLGPVIHLGWLGASFRIYQQNVVVWIVATLLYNIPSTLIYLYFDGPEPLLYPWILIFPHTVGVPVTTSNWQSGLEMLIRLPFTVFLHAGLFLMANKAVRGEPIRLFDLFLGGKSYFALLIFSFCSDIVFCVATLLCCIPGAMIWALLWPVNAMIVDGRGLQFSVKQSYRFYSWDLWNGALLAMVVGLLTASSIFSLGLASLVTFPMTIIISALMYRELANATGLSFSQPVAEEAPLIAGAWPPAPRDTKPSDQQGSAKRSGLMKESKVGEETSES